MNNCKWLKFLDGKTFTIQKKCTDIQQSVPVPVIIIIAIYIASNIEGALPLASILSLEKKRGMGANIFFTTVGGSIIYVVPLVT